METQDESQLTLFQRMAVIFEDIMDALTPDTNPIDPMDIERHKWLQYIITIMFYIAITILFVYFFVTTYIEDKNNIFLSPLRESVPSNCKTNPFMIDGVYVVDRTGHWENDVNFDPGQRFYMMEMKGVSIDEEEYSAMMTYFEKEVKKVHDRLLLTDESEAFIAWSSLNVQYITKSSQGTVNFYTVGDASYIMDTNVLLYSFVSHNTMCIPKSTLKYNLPASSYYLTFENTYTYVPSQEPGLSLDPNIMVLDEPCPGIFNITNDFTDEKGATSTVPMDIRSIMTALSVNYKYQSVDELASLITTKLFPGFQFARDDFYAGMNPVFCFDKEVCGIVMGGTIAIPFFFHTGFEQPTASPCFIDDFTRCPSDGSPCMMSDEMPAYMSFLFISKDKMQVPSDEKEITAMHTVRDLAKSLFAPNRLSTTLDKLFRLSRYTVVLELFARNYPGAFTLQELYGYPLPSCASSVGLLEDTEISFGEISNILLQDICGDVPCSLLNMAISHRLDYFQYLSGLVLNAYGNSWIGALELWESLSTSGMAEEINVAVGDHIRTLEGKPMLPKRSTASSKLDKIAKKSARSFEQGRAKGQKNAKSSKLSILSTILQEATNDTVPEGSDTELPYGRVESIYQPQIFAKIKTKPPVKLLESVMNCRKSQKQLVIDTLGIAHSNTELLLNVFMLIFILMTAYGLNIAANKYGFRGVYSSDDNQKEFRYLVAQTITKLANRDDEEMEHLIDHLSALCQYEHTVLKAKPKSPESMRKVKSNKVHPVESNMTAENYPESEIAAEAVPV